MPDRSYGAPAIVHGHDNFRPPAPPSTVPTTAATTAILLGASGSVGQALLAELRRSPKFSHVIVIARRPLDAQAGAGAKLVECLVPDMQPRALTQAVVDALKSADSDAVGFSVLGVGAGTAKLSLAEHRAIDVELNAAFAKGLKDSGRVHHLAFMSAVGANAHAKTTGSGAAGLPRYARVKGEAEQAVLSQGLAVVSIFRPSLIIGSAHTPGALATLLALLAPLMPAKYRPIRTTEIAQAMVAAARTAPDRHGVYSYSEMKALIARGA
jgi:uncharacterized protein YbjT (DUF2867 family)